MFTIGASSFICLALLTSAVSFAPSTAQAGSLSRRMEQIPYIDYIGIESASRDALNHTLYRRGLADSSAAYAQIATRELNNRQYSPSTPVCKSIKKRKEWRDLTYAEKKGYTQAIKCLQTKGDYGISPVSDTCVAD